MFSSAKSGPDKIVYFQNKSVVYIGVQGSRPLSAFFPSFS